MALSCKECKVRFDLGAIACVVLSDGELIVDSTASKGQSEQRAGGRGDRRELKLTHLNAV